MNTEGFNMPEMWIAELKDRLTALPEHPTEFSPELVRSVTDINVCISMTMRNGVEKSAIEALPNYNRYQEAVIVVGTHNQVVEKQKREDFDRELHEYEEREARILEEAKALVIPENIVAEARGYLNMLADESADFRKLAEVSEDWRRKQESDLRYRIAKLELRGSKDEALQLRIEYMRSLQE